MALNATTTEQINESGENVSEIQALTARAQDLAHSISIWSNAYVILVALTVLLAAGLFITQFIVIRKGKQLETVQGELMAAKDAKTGLDIARANESSAKAEARTAEANLQIERLKKDTAWRRLTKEEHAELVAQLKSRPRKVVMWNFGDPECSNFSDEIESAFKAAGWEVERTQGFTNPSHEIKITPTDETQFLIQALRRIGIDAVLDQPLTTTARRDGSIPRLTIGLRPRPF